MSSTQEVGEIFGQGSGPAHAMMRSPTVLIASIGLWGMNVYMFRLFRIHYVQVLKYDLLKMNAPEVLVRQSSRQSVDGDDEDFNDQHVASITWYRLVSFSLILLLLLHFTYFYYIEVLGRDFIGAVLVFYGVVVVYILLPIPSNAWLRKATKIVLYRSWELINPRLQCFSANPKPVPFVDVFFADAMCSLSKVFFDWGMLLHMASHYPDPVPADVHNIVFPSAAAAVPFVIRARQCIIMFNYATGQNDPHRFSHVWNAIKYSTSIFPLCLSAYQKTIPPAQAQSLEPLLIALIVVNSLYALFWDVKMDWGLFEKPSACVTGLYPMEKGRPTTCWHAILRPRLRFGIFISFVILVADAVLRFSWTLRFWHHLFPNGDSFVLCSQFLEVFRRALWNLLRVDWENLKHSRVDLSESPTGRSTDEETIMLTSGKRSTA